jgi:DNA polymerase-3 subunit beta
MSSSVLDGVLRRAAPFAGNETSKDPATVILAFAEDQLTVSSGGGEKGTGSESVPVEYDAELLQVMCKIAYLRDAVKSAGSDRISLSITGGMRPLLVRPVGDETFLHVVMPIKLPTSVAA